MLPQGNHRFRLASAPVVTMVGESVLYCLLECVYPLDKLGPSYIDSSVGGRSRGSVT